ncbi:biotin--[acetyl-CoA-carboxylase] ligase (plasmid) [Enterobacter sp. D2]|uniref:biotin--[acetyl-CoA-carboxylase] ligase n=1 Tax=Enterobacter sp. D2 TaxID=3102784 RepID=UPI002ACA06E1|nr:biotin--[acetyl-CoA-carboxylase] ligase [Enterobacter sp. D2]MDZ5730955.1 biotin--[acetyl-CoA-carboxylase] ligase [Enterobacter sp. D2]
MTELITIDSVDSTNNEARRIVQHTGNMNFALSAREQTAGKGRYNRKWISAPGNIAVTIVVPLPDDRTSLPTLSLVAGIAIHDALSLIIRDADVQIKWPNDILINGAKVSGTLIEADPRAIYVGIGINMTADNMGLENIAAGLAGFTDKDTTDVLQSLLHRWDDYFSLWKTYGFSVLRSSYEGRMKGLNQMTEISLDAGKTQIVSGICRGTDTEGRILLETPDGVVKAWNYGDVLFHN